MERNQEKRHLIVCVGASAGGLQAVTEFLNRLPKKANGSLTVILAQHLSPTYKSRLSELLARETNLEVAEAQSGNVLKPGTLVICPPDREISFEEDKIKLEKSPVGVGPKPSIDNFLASAAAVWKQDTIAVILSGTGSDGSRGVEEVSDKGGIIMVQNPDVAKYDGMPHAAIGTNLVDFVGTAAQIADQVANLAAGKTLHNLIPGRAEDSPDAYKSIMKLLSKRTGTDFSNYKTATINRRLEKRLVVLKMKNLEEYLAYCKKSAKEIDILFDSVLIGVTEFFRDHEAFLKLREQLHQLLENKSNGDPVRAWIPGCATGEEAYTIAIIIQDFYKDRKDAPRIQIFATDIDEVALSIARAGIYHADKLAKIPDPFKAYFKPKGNDQFEVNKLIRSSVLFSKHDITANPPFLKLDLISCRNLLIYFGQVLQKRVMPVFHYSLNTNGLLMLGKSETVGTFNDLFSAIDGRLKIYRKKFVPNTRDIQLPTKKPTSTSGFKPTPKSTHSLQKSIEKTLLHSFEHPFVVINDDLDILEIFGDVNDFIQWRPGLMSANIVRQCIDPLQIELRTVINKSVKDQEVVSSRYRKFEYKKRTYLLKIKVKPVQSDDLDQTSLYMVIFEMLPDDLPIISQPQTETESTNTDNQRIIELEQELAATKEDLQSYVEELETANEELQSLNEELQSSNEELQSTNEELETSNEELQSTNEEVQIAYGELSELNQTLLQNEKNLLATQQQLQAMLQNTQQTFVLLQHNYEIISFNEAAAPTFKKIFKKVIQTGNSLVDYLPKSLLEPLVSDFKLALEGEGVSKEYEIKSGQSISYYLINFTPVRFNGQALSMVSLSMLDITAQRNSERALNAAEALRQSVYNVIPAGVLVTDAEGHFVEVNQGAEKLLGYTKAELLGNSFHMLLEPRHRKEKEKQYQKLFQNKDTRLKLFDGVYTKSGDRLNVQSQSAIIDEAGEPSLVVTSIEDITEIEASKTVLKSSETKLEQLSQDLQERIKEQTSLYKLVQLGNETDTIAAFLQAVKPVIQKGFLDPDLIGVKIIYNKQVWKTDRYPVKSKEIVENLYVKGKKSGSIAVAYRNLKGKDDLEFLTEEYSLVKALANNISQVIENKLLHQSVQDSQAFMHQIINTVPDGISIIQSNGKHVMVNQAFIKMLGFSERELLDSSLPHIYWPEEDLEEIQKAFEATMHAGNEQLSFELKFKRKNGERFPVLVSPAEFVALSTNEKQYVAIVKDISEFKKRENALAASESNYRFLVENTTDMICRHYPDGLYKDVTSSSESIIGYNKSELLGKSPYTHFHPDDIRRIKEDSHEKVLEQQDVSRIQYRYKHKNGHYVWLDTISRAITNEQGEVVELITSSRDITIQKEFEIKIREREILLNRAQNMARLGVWIMDPKSNVFTFSSPFTRELYNVPDGEVFSIKHVQEIFHPDDFAGFEERFKALQVKNPEPFEHQHRIIRDGKTQWLWVKGFPDFNENGKFEKIFGITLDITHVMDQERELNATVEALKRSNDELVQFAYVASHDLQEPLRMIGSFTQLLQRKYQGQLDETADKYINYAVDGAQRLQQMINDLLQYSRVNTSDLPTKETDLNELAKRVITGMQTSIEAEKATVNVSELPTLQVVPSLMERLLQNLISNALKYRSEEPPAIDINVIESPSEFIFSVKDNGIGIDEKFKEKIFVIFQRLQKDDRGTGIGLAICKRIVHKHRGQMWVESKPGKGSTFYFTLPKED